MGCQVSPYIFIEIITASRCWMFNFSKIFLFVVCLTDRAGLTVTGDVLYEMHCDCGRRDSDQLSEMDCEESARLEAQQQGSAFYVSLNFHHISNLIISI